jgi:alkyl hydroperoxide reductase subunit AhpC
MKVHSRDTYKIVPMTTRGIKYFIDVNINLYGMESIKKSETLNFQNIWESGLFYVFTRGRFIIDPDGIVQGFEVLTPPVGRNVSESLRQVQAFQLVRESKGTEATPSGWKPGKMTLKPNPDLVGKVWEVWKTSMAFDD